jgi:hypothetical protein
MPSLPVASAYTPQTYAPLFVMINGTNNTQVQSISIDQMSGSQDVETINAGWAGVVKGAERSECDLKGVLPLSDTDSGGFGFTSGGMTAGGIELAGTMITSQNQNANLPVTFVIQVGGQGTQQYQFRGFVKNIKTDYGVGKQCDWTMHATGKFSLFA